MVTRLHLPHATLLSSHRKQRAQLAFEQWPILVGGIFHPGRSHGCYPSALQGAHFHAGVIHLLLYLEIKKGQGFFGNPSKAYTNLIPDQYSLYRGGQHTLAFYIKCVRPLGRQAAVLTYSQSHQRTAVIRVILTRSRTTIEPYPCDLLVLVAAFTRGGLSRHHQLS